MAEPSTSSGRVFAGHGLTLPETAVMELHDAGLSPDMITQQLGQRESRVRQTIGNYAFYGLDETARDARRGSALLLAAIERVYGKARP